MTAAALAGLKVIDLGQAVSAPWCARLFADYGADVIKVEPPRTGDVARHWGPFPGDRPDPEKSGLYFFLNTGKRGVTLDVSRAEGRELLGGLVRGADVLIENHLPPRMRDWGLDYATLAQGNPDLVMISITPFGQTGPYRDWHGCDLNAFHLTGASSRYCGRPGEAPLEHGTFAADFCGGAAGAAWGLAAVLGRRFAGGGQQLDVACAEAIAATFSGSQNIGAVALTGAFDRRTGVGMSLRAPATILPCRDGHAWILAIEDAQWQGLVRAMGNPAWTEAEVFRDLYMRAEHADAMYPLLAEWTRAQSKWEIMERCQAEGVPVTAVFTVAEVADHPHLRERGCIVALEHAALGSVRTLGAPFRLQGSAVRPTRAAPLLGEHNAEVYRDWLGLDERELDRLRLTGVV
ncbi:MAG: CoA transferase [Gammaproteobacteria bacterium]|nr:CoA transferase [Gammaproteobacteria bacterium]